MTKGHVVAAVLSRAQLSDFMHFLCLRVSQLLIILKYKFKTFDFTFEKCELWRWKHQKHKVNILRYVYSSQKHEWTNIYCKHHY